MTITAMTTDLWQRNSLNNGSLPTYPGDNNIPIPFDYSCVDMNTSILSLAIALSAVSITKFFLT